MTKDHSPAAPAGAGGRTTQNNCSRNNRQAAGDPVLAAPGTRANPIEVHEWHYKGCHHAALRPPVQKGQHFRVVGYVDVAGRCPSCGPRKGRAR